MNMRAAFSIAEAPLGDSGLAEPMMAALAEGVSAVFFDDAKFGGKDGGKDGGKGAGRARLTCLLDGAPVAPPFVCASLDLAGGGRRHLALLGRPLEELVARRVTLALDGRPVAMADPDWLQPPVRDAAALIERLTPEARRRLLRLTLGTGASLFLRTRPAFPAAARDLLALCDAREAAPIAQAVFGDHQILTYRTADPGVAEPVALTPSRIWPLRGAAFRREGALLHLHLPARLGPEAEAVAIGEGILRLAGAPADLPALPPARWAAGREAAVVAWLEERLRIAAAESPGASAVLREMRADAAQPRLGLRHLSATPAGLVYALDLADPEGFVSAIRLERGGARVEIAPRVRLDGAGTIAGFAALPGATDAPCQVSLLHHSGRLRAIHAETPAAYDGSIPAGFAEALAEERAAGLPGAAVAALARARATLEARPVPAQVQDFGLVARPVLTVLAPAGDNPDLARTRAAMIFGEPGGAGVEVALTVEEGPKARGLRRIAAETAAIYGVAHRIVTLPPGAGETEALRAGLAAARGAAVLALGAETLPEGRGWVAAWRRRLARCDLAGAVLAAADGSVVHAGAPRGRAPALGLPRAMLPRAGRRPGLFFTPEVVGFSRRAVVEIIATRAEHPDARVLLAALASRILAAGGQTLTDFSLNARRYGQEPRPDPFAEELFAREVSQVCGGVTC